MKKCCIVIPIYKAELNRIEKIVLDNLLQKIQNYPRCFMAPSDLELGWYQKNYQDIDQQVFADWKSDSLDAYNQLMMKESFYKRFDENEYILIFQLDGFILKGDSVLDEFLCLLAVFAVLCFDVVEIGNDFLSISGTCF